MGGSRRKQAATPESATRLEPFKQTKLCKFNQLGKCKRGKECSYAHSLEEVQEQPDFQKTRLCKNFGKKGTCALGDDCKFAHGVEELRTEARDLPEDRVKTDETPNQGISGISDDWVYNNNLEVPAEANLEEMAEGKQQILDALFDAVQIRLERLQAAQEQMQTLQKAQEERVRLQQLCKQQQNLTPQQSGLAVPVLLAANCGLMRLSALPILMQNGQLPAPKPPSTVVHPPHGAVSNRSTEYSLQEMSPGNIDSFNRLLNVAKQAETGRNTHETVMSHSTEESLPSCSWEHMSAYSQPAFKVDSVGDLPSFQVRTLESLPGGDLGGFSRQTTLEGCIAPFSRQTTPAADFCDSPYCSDFDAASETGEEKAEALDTVIEVEKETEGSSDQSSSDEKTTSSARVAWQDARLESVSRDFSHFGEIKASRRVSSADGRMQR